MRHLFAIFLLKFNNNKADYKENSISSSSFSFHVRSNNSKFPKESKMTRRIILSKTTKKVAELKRHTQVFAFLIQVPKDAPSSSQQTCQMIQIYYHLRVRVAARFLKGIIRMKPSLKMPIKIQRRCYIVLESRSGLSVF